MPLDMLAAAVVTRFLAPALKEGAEKVLAAVADKVGEQAAEHTEGLIGTLWAKVDQLLGGSERDKATLENFKEDPEVYEEAVTRLLQRRFDENPELGAEIQKLIDGPVPGTSMSGAQVWNAGVVGVVDARQANFAGAHGVHMTGAVVGDPAQHEASRVPPAPRPASPPSDQP